MFKIKKEENKVYYLNREFPLNNLLNKLKKKMKITKQKVKFTVKFKH